MDSFYEYMKIIIQVTNEVDYLLNIFIKIIIYIWKLF